MCSNHRDTLVVLCPLGRHMVNCKQNKPSVTLPQGPYVWPRLPSHKTQITKHIKGHTLVSFMNFADLVLVICRLCGLWPVMSGRAMTDIHKLL